MNEDEKKWVEISKKMHDAGIDLPESEKPSETEKETIADDIHKIRFLHWCIWADVFGSLAKLFIFMQEGCINKMRGAYASMQERGENE